MAARDLIEARKAYLLRDPERSKRAHQAHNKEGHMEGGELIKSAIYSGLDGILTVFAIAAAAFGSHQFNQVVIILGLSSLFGDALSMAIGDYMGTKSEIEFQKAERKREEWEVTNHPEGEMEEMKEIYINKGLTEEDAKVVVKILAKTPRAWVDIMMVEELGLLESAESPFKNGLVSFCSFIVLGFIPLLPYIIDGIFTLNKSISFTFYLSLLLACVTMFSLGAVKTKFTGKNIFISGIETLIIGGVAAGVAYLIGWLLNTNSESVA